jgi:hypothetical protein
MILGLLGFYGLATWGLITILGRTPAPAPATEEPR